MAGYTPLFDTLTKGTLCGRWPDIGLWPIVLSLADRHGVVDVSHNALAGMTGLGLDEVIACMARFCQPDPQGRSKECGGARLARLDDHRNWGWKVVDVRDLPGYGWRDALRPGQSEWARLRQTAFLRDDFTCQYCGQRGGRLECDHIHPVSRGGGHDLENLATACWQCNRSKRDKTLDEWLQ